MLSQGSWAVPANLPNATDTSEPILALEIMAELEAARQPVEAAKPAVLQTHVAAPTVTNTFRAGSFFRRNKPAVRHGVKTSHVVSPLPHTYLKYVGTEGGWRVNGSGERRLAKTGVGD